MSQSPKSWSDVELQAQEAKMKEMYDLLRRWQVHSKYLFDCHDLCKAWVSAGLEGIIKKTNEVLDGKGEEG